MNSSSHEKYLEKLNNKGIEVFPLEEYTKSKIKIFHKCTCGNEWKVQPSSILRGLKCGCNNIGKIKLTDEEYIKKLISKKIKVRPLEKYQGLEKKIDHLCECGNEWLIQPRMVIRGRKCGCGHSGRHDEKFYKGKKTILYYIKVNELYKVGVTLFTKPTVEKNIYKGRFNYDINKGVDIKIIKYEVFSDGAKAYKKEQNILKKNINNKYKGKDILLSGNTELLTEEIKNGI